MGTGNPSGDVVTEQIIIYSTENVRDSLTKTIPRKKDFWIYLPFLNPFYLAHSRTSSRRNGNGTWIMLHFSVFKKNISEYGKLKLDSKPQIW